MIKKIPHARYIIGFFLIVIPYFAVKGGLANNDMFLEQLLAISHAFLIPVIIGFVLIWPLFRYKSNNKNYNITRVFIGGGMLVINLITFFSLVSYVFSFISDSGISIIDFYFMNADFSARIFLIFVEMCIAGILLKPFITYAQMKKNSDSWKKKPDDFNNNLY